MNDVDKIGETAPIYNDFIPAGEDAGAYTEDGFSDFVPAPQPQYHHLEEETVTEEQQETSTEEVQEASEEPVVTEEDLTPEVDETAQEETTEEAEIPQPQVAQQVVDPMNLSDDELLAEDGEVVSEEVVQED